MGGALGVAGNIYLELEPANDGSAEWNAFADPEAVQTVWESLVPIVLAPLDSANQVPVTRTWMHKIALQRQCKVSDLMGMFYALVAPFGCKFWDAMAASFIMRPDLFEIRVANTSVITEGASQGRTVEIQPQGDEEETYPFQSKFKLVQVLDKVNAEEFYKYLLKQFKYLC